MQHVRTSTVDNHQPDEVTTSWPTNLKRRNEESAGIDKGRASLISWDEWCEERDVSPIAAKDTQRVRAGINTVSGSREINY